MNPKKIAFFIDLWPVFRDFIGTGFIEYFSNNHDLSIVLVTNERCIPQPDDLPKNGNVRAIVTDFKKRDERKKLRSTIDKIAHNIMRDDMVCKHPNDTLALTRKAIWEADGRNINMRLAYARPLKHLGFKQRFISNLIEPNAGYPDVAQVLDEEKPDLIVYSNMLLGQMDCLREARKRNIPTVLNVPSWDQSTSKGPLSFRPDAVINWSRSLNEQFCEIQEYPMERCHDIGVLYFDPYFRKNTVQSREEFCKANNIDPRRKILIYTMANGSLTDCALPWIDYLYQFIKEDRFEQPCHLIIRTSPMADQLSYENYEGLPNLTMQHPSGDYDERGKNWMPNKHDETQRINTFSNSDVIINMQSSMILDGSCLGKPIINLGYDADMDLPYHRSVRRFYEYTHARTVVEEKAAWKVHSDSELIEAVNQYLKAPDTHKQERERCLKKICGYTDENAHKRLSNTLLQLLEKTTS